MRLDESMSFGNCQRAMYYKFGVGLLEAGTLSLALADHVGSRHIPHRKPSISPINSGKNHCANDDKICVKLHLF